MRKCIKTYKIICLKKHFISTFDICKRIKCVIYNNGDAQNILYHVLSKHV